MKQNLAIGVDIGGSHISCAAVDLESFRIINETRTERAVDNKAEASKIINVWVQAITDVIKMIPGDSLKGIGFGMPGPFDYVKGISYIRGVAKYENLYGCNVKNAISDSLGFPDDFPVRFMNDVSTFAVGEALIGKASKAERSMSVTLGTGFGSAFIANRIPIVDGPEVPKLGCVYYLPYGDNIADDYFSTRWFIGKYKMLTGKELSGVKEFAKLAGTDKKGTNVLGLVEAAGKMGFLAKGVRGEWDSLFKIPKPAIAHVVVREVLQHYIVLVKTTDNYIEIMDPADGELHRLPHE